MIECFLYSVKCFFILKPLFDKVFQSKDIFIKFYIKNVHILLLLQRLVMIVVKVVRIAFFLGSSKHCQQFNFES